SSFLVESVVLVDSEHSIPGPAQSSAKSASAFWRSGELSVLRRLVRPRLSNLHSQLRGSAAERVPAPAWRLNYLMTWLQSTTWAWVFFVSEWAIRVVMLASVPFRRTPAAAKGWLLLIFFEPWIGLVLYLLIGRATLPRWRSEQVSQLPEVMGRVLERLANHPNGFHPQLAPELSQAGPPAENPGQMPVLGGNAAEILVDYDAVFDRLVADIDRAEHHVHLLFYIFADDPATAPVIDALGRASRRGVRCRVLVDSVGSRSALSTLIPKL